jgi:hypothetical protein
VCTGAFFLSWGASRALDSAYHALSTVLERRVFRSLPLHQLLVRRQTPMLLAAAAVAAAAAAAAAPGPVAAAAAAGGFVQSSLSLLLLLLLLLFLIIEHSQIPRVWLRCAFDYAEQVCVSLHC